MGDKKFTNVLGISLQDLNTNDTIHSQQKSDVLKTFRSQLDLLKGAMKHYEVGVNYAIPPIIVIEALNCLQSLSKNIAGVTPLDAFEINKSLDNAVLQCKFIQERCELSHVPVDKKAPVVQNDEYKSFGEQKVDKNKKNDMAQQEKLDALFIQEVKQVPTALSTKDCVVYKVITVKNCGTLAFPSKTFIECRTAPETQKMAIPVIHPGREANTLAMLHLPIQAGEHTYTFGFVTENDDGTFTKFGQAFELRFSIMDDNEEDKWLEIQGELASKHHEYSKGLEYSEEVRMKARALKEVFPQYDIEELCVHTSNGLNKSIEQLINSYINLHSSIVS